ncbi:MAG TPA: hypothetical protein VIE66_02735 [Methylocella sp.]
MVAIIENPAYSGGLQNPNGQSIGEALNGIAGAFMNSGQQQLRAAALQEAQQKAAEYQQKQAAQGTIANAFTHLQDQTQDYEQDAPDYATPPPRTFSLSDPEAFNRAVLALGNPAEIGKALQLSSAIQGGKSDPMVYAGAVPGGGEAQTFEGQQDANNLAIRKSAADAQSSAAQKPYVYNDPITGAPHVTNEAVAATGQLPAGGLPQQSTDQQKASQLNRMVFNPASGASDMTDSQQQVLGLDKQTPRPATAAEKLQYGVTANTPLYIDEKGAPHILSPAGTTINVGGADSAAQTEAKAEAQKSGEAAGDRANTMLKAAAAAPENIARYQALRDVLAHSNTGPGTEFKGTVVGWANSLGVPPSIIEGLGLNPNQAMTNDIAQKISNKMVAESIGARNGGFPATGFNVAERQFIEKMYPNIQSQPGANLANSDMLIAQERQKQDMADEFGAYRLAQRQAGKAPSFSDFEDQYRAAHKNDNIFQPIIDNFNTGKYGPIGAGAPVLNPVAAGQPQQPQAQRPAQGAPVLRYVPGQGFQP